VDRVRQLGRRAGWREHLAWHGTESGLDPWVRENPGLDELGNHPLA
jgi:hypothetical protein